MFDNIIGAIAIFTGLWKTRRWKVVWRKMWLTLSICGWSTKKAKGNKQVLICLNTTQKVLTTATSSWASSRVFDLLECFNRDRSYVSTDYWELTNKEELYEGRGNKRCKEIYIPLFGVSIGAKDWALSVKGNPSWLFLGFALPSTRLRSFLK